MATNVKVGSFNLGTSSGNLAVTGVGFQPKAIVFWGSRVTGTSTGGVAGFDFFLGMATSSSSRAALSNSGANAASFADNDTRWDSSKCIIVWNNGSPPTVNGEADLVSFDSDGFTINRTDAFADDYRCNFIAYGGSDITNVAMGTGSWAFPGTDHVVTSPGFQPDMLFAFGNHTPTVIGSPNNTDTFHIGFASGPSNQVATGFEMADGSGQIIARRYLRTGRLLSNVQGVGNNTNDLSLKSFDANGFTIQVHASEGQNYEHSWLAIKGGNWKVSTFSTQTTAGTFDTTGLGFRPGGVFLLSHALASESASLVPNPDLEMVVGAASGPSEQAATWFASQNGGGSGGSVLSDTYTYQHNSAAFVKRQVTGHEAESEFALSKILADGFRWNQTVADTGSRLVAYLATGPSQTNFVDVFTDGATSSATGDARVSGDAIGDEGATGLQLEDTAYTLDAEENSSATGTASVATDASVSAASGTSVVPGSLAVTLEDSTSAAVGSPVVPGALAVTTDDSSVSASGSVSDSVSGSASVTLDASSSAATGSPVVPGTLAATLDAATLGASGTPVVAGSVAVALDASVGAASGTSVVAGSLAVTLGASTLAASGAPVVNGSAAVSTDTATSAASGTPVQVGTVSAAASDATLAAAGSADNSVGGSLARTLASATVSAAGSPVAAGSLAVALDAATGAASGTSVVSGAVAVSLAGATGAASGTSVVAGAVAVSLGAATVSASGSQPSVGSLAVTLASARAAASGVADNSVSGSLAVSLASAALSAAGNTTVTGNAAVALSGAQLSATGYPTLTGSADVALQGASLLSIGSPALQGALAVALADATVAGIGGDGSAVLLAHWKLDDTGTRLADSVGTHHLTTHGGPAWTWGHLDRARRFERAALSGGADQWATGTPSAGMLAAARSSWSWTGWVRQRDPSGSTSLRILFVILPEQQQVAEVEAENSLVDIRTRASDGRVSVLWEYGPGTNQNTNASGTEIPAFLTANAWTHLSVTFTAGGVLTIYINGASMGQKTGVPLATGGGLGRIWLGAYYGGFGSYVVTSPVQADLDDVRFWAGVLTPTEVLALAREHDEVDGFELGPDSGATFAVVSEVADLELASDSSGASVSTNIATHTSTAEPAVLGPARAEKA